MNISIVEQYIKTQVNWQRVFSMISHLGTDLNEMMNRSDKGALIEMAIDTFSNGKLQRCNLPGCDHLVPELNSLKIEVKYQQQSLFNKKGTLKQKTKTIPLKNPMGSDVKRTLHQTFDYILLLDDYGLALTTFSVVKQHSTETRDQIIAQLPTDILNIIFTPSQFIKQDLSVISNRFILLKNQIMMTYLNQFEQINQELKDVSIV